MNALPKISGYGDYLNQNYGLNALSVDLGTITLYYSYTTIIGYKDAQDGLVVSENRWSTTTGKHLNWLNSDKKARLPRADFEAKLQAALARHIS